ncbi:hypothetical protein GGI20_000052 [Coemansia sp. BCRC 34301]|nr:hypothetical protein GGI20_000052 [Coemansia sp. BCRC 34301]
MDAHTSRAVQWPRGPYVHGINNVMFPPSALATLDNTRSRRSSLDSTAAGSHSSNRQILSTHSAVQVDKPWWQRLLIDAMLVPFTQGFMLTLAANWVRYWRQTGGLMGLFRSHRSKAL